MKLCVPSYLFPGTWLENLEALRSREWVDGVELLFFTYDEDARAILERERGGIAALSKRFELSLHLPDPLSAADEELVASTRDFISLYVLHPPGRGKSAADAAAWPALVELWRARYGDDFLLEYTGCEAFAAAEAVLPGLPLCADTGCLLREGQSPADWLEGQSPAAWLEGQSPGNWIARRSGPGRAAPLGRIREIHLHGVQAGVDHVPPRGGEAWLEELAPVLARYDGRVELEIFSDEGVEAARAALGRSLARSMESAPEASP